MKKPPKKYYRKRLVLDNLDKEIRDKNIIRRIVHFCEMKSLSHPNFKTTFLNLLLNDLKLQLK